MSEQILHEFDDGTQADISGVYDTLVDAVSFFRGSAEYKHPNANFRGCCISSNPFTPHMRRFSFIDRHSRMVSIELNLRQMFHNPKLYFDHLMEHLANTMEHANNEGRILVDVAKPIVRNPMAIAVSAAVGAH